MSATAIFAFFYMQTYVVLWCYIDLWSIRGGGGVILPLVYVHSSISETYSV